MIDFVCPAEYSNERSSHLSAAANSLHSISLPSLSYALVVEVPLLPVTLVKLP